jgi:hypothetical protein
MGGTFHPIAPTSDPGRAQRDEHEGPKTYTTSDFSDMEDALPWWRAVAIFGVLLFVEGFVLWGTFSGVNNGTVLRVPPLVYGLSAVMGAAGLFAAVLSFGQEALAFFAGALTLVIVCLAAPASILLHGFGSSATGALIIGSMAALGSLLVLVGAVGLARTYRALGEEDQIRSAPVPR